MTLRKLLAVDVLSMVVQAAAAFAARTASDASASAAVAAAYVAAASAAIDETEQRYGSRSPEWGEVVAAIGNVTDASALLHGGMPDGRSPAVNTVLQQFANRLGILLQESIPPAQLAATHTILAALFDIRLDLGRLADRPPGPPQRALQVSLDTDGDWRRLKVHNPNSVTARSCSVQVVEYSASGALPPDVVLPGRGFRFGWTTHGRDNPTRYADIPPAAHDYADLHQVVTEQGYFTHVAPGEFPNTYMPFWGLPAGTYSYELAVASGGVQGIPTTTVAIEAAYDGGAGLELNIKGVTLG